MEQEFFSMLFFMASGRVTIGEPVPLLSFQGSLTIEWE